MMRFFAHIPIHSLAMIVAIDQLVVEKADALSISMIKSSQAEGNLGYYPASILTQIGEYLTSDSDVNFSQQTSEDKQLERRSENYAQSPI